MDVRRGLEDPDSGVRQAFTHEKVTWENNRKKNEAKNGVENAFFIEEGIRTPALKTTPSRKMPRERRCEHS